MLIYGVFERVKNDRIVVFGTLLHYFSLVLFVIKKWSLEIAVFIDYLRYNIHSISKKLQ